MRGKLSHKLPLSLAAAAVVVGAVLSPVAGASNMPVATWTGAAGDNKFSTAGNWKEGRAPVDGAKLVFNCVAGTRRQEIVITNDMSAKIAEISTLSTEGVDHCKPYDIKGNTNFQENAKFSGAANNESNGGVPLVWVNAKGLKHLTAGNTGVVINNAQELSIETYTATGYQMYNPLFKTKKAVINSTDKGTIFLGNVEDSITLQPGSALNIDSRENEKIVTNIIFQGDGSIGDGYYNSLAQFGAAEDSKKATITLSGDIVVNGIVKVKLPSWQTLKITGNLSGTGKFVTDDNKGVFINEAKSNTTATESGVVDNIKEQTISVEGDKKQDDLTVTRKQVAVLNGSRRSVTVDEDGILKGEGTVEWLNVNGIVAPGNSPGKITVLQGFDIGSTGVYRAEILNKDTYDKIIASTVHLVQGATLQLSYLPDGKINNGDTFTIIEVTGGNAVDGIFKDLPEGAEVRVGNATFKISYKGGDGNDVTLTAQNDSVAPKAPNTGAASLVANPVAAIAGAAVAAVALFAGSKRRATSRR